MPLSNFRFPTPICFGEQAIAEVPKVLNEKGLGRPLVVSDQTLVNLSLFKEFIILLKENGISPSIYSDAIGNPVESHVTNGVKKFNECKADSVVLIGGGCALDVGKAVALMVNHPGNIFDYEDDKVGARPIDKTIPYLLAIPTTAGTGSEVGGSSVISHDDSHEKVIIWSNRLVPSMVIADPKLCINLPKGVSAATGIDALTHNIEAYLAKNFHPLCDGIALEGMRLVWENLETVVNEPNNIKARGNMLIASMMGGLAFQKGLGVTHSCAHALSTCHNLHHGLANSLMLPVCLKFNSEVVPERFERLAYNLSCKGSGTKLISNFIEELKSLQSRIGLPKNLSEVNIKPSDKLIDVAFKDSCHQNNPRICTKEDFSKIFTAAMN